MPELHGWPVSPDFAVMLIDLVESNDYDLVIEFGSGTSTLLMAIALARTAKRRRRSAPAVQVAFEHLETFHQQTRSRWNVPASLMPCNSNWLACSLGPVPRARRTRSTPAKSKLHAIVHAMHWSTARALVIVDGPPAATGSTPATRHCRSCLRSLQGVAMDVLLDDHARPEEQEISQDVACRSRGRGAPRGVARHPPRKGRLPAQGGRRLNSWQASIEMQNEGAFRGFGAQRR